MSPEIMSAIKLADIHRRKAEKWRCKPGWRNARIILRRHLSKVQKMLTRARKLEECETREQ